MEEAREAAATQEAPANPTGHAGHRVVLALTFLSVLAAVSVSVGLVVYTAWRHDLENGFFALVFATLSARTVLAWALWRAEEGRLEPPK